ncbi:MAG: glycosyltransferase family 2 protein [Culicoidibacterales bacterium]
MAKLKNIWTTYKYNGIKGIIRKIKYKHKDMYNVFIKHEEIISLADMRLKSENFSYKPLFSIIIPIFQPKLSELESCLNSILAQGYPYFEICLVDDGSDNLELKNFLTALQANNKCIKLQINKVNEGISKASNDAISLSRGHYLGLVDQDDMLAAHALYTYALALQEQQYDFLYSDEDMINQENRRFNPQFKPDWSPHTLLSRMYVNHFSVYKKEIVEQVEGFRTEFNGSQDYDLLLRASPYLDKVFHSTQILYHWRTSEHSIATSIENKAYIYQKATNAITQFLTTQNIVATATSHQNLLIYNLEIELNSLPLVSIIIPFKDGLSMTKKLLASIAIYGGYKQIELILVDNQSSSVEKRAYEFFLQNFSKENDINYKIITADFPFNYAKINNIGVSHSAGEYLLFLNNDVEFMMTNSIKTLISVAQLPKTGAVGMTLLYPNGSIQHAGVIMGYHEVAGHSGVGMSKGDFGYYGRNVSLYNFSAVTAACLLLKKSQFNQVKGFEEKLAVAYNDVDLCLKLRESGYYNVNVGSIQALHHESITRGTDNLANPRYQQECQYMKKKWQKYLSKDPFYNENLSINVGELYQISLKKEV